MKIKEEGEKAGLKLKMQKINIMASRSQHFMANRCGNSGNSDRLYFLDSKIIADGDCSHEIKWCWLLGGELMTNLDSMLRSREISLPTEFCLVEAMVFPVVMYGCESWTIKKAEHRRTDAFELWCWRSLLRVPWSKEIQPVHPKGNQSWIFIVRIDAEPETPIFWPHDVKSWLIWKDPDGGKDWGQEEKGMTEGEMVGRHHQLNGHHFE